MCRKQFGLIWLLLTTMLVACGQTPPPTAPPTDTRVPLTPTPRVTETPLPPRPAIPYTPMPPELLAPIVVQRSPNRGQALAPDGVIALTFDKPMDTQAVSKALRVERAGTTDVIAGTLSWSSTNTVQFTPAQPLPRDTAFDVILTQDAAAETGEPLQEPYTFRFSTDGYLQVAQVIPEHGTTGVETDAAITVIFNRPVVPLTTLREMEALPAPLSFQPPVEGSGEWLNTSIYVFTPAAPLAGGIEYEIRVSGDLTDISGAVLQDDYRWRFTTVPPSVTWVTPGEDASLVDIRTAITVQFNQPVDLASAESAFSLTAAGILNTPISGVLDVVGSTLVFTPSSDLAFDTRYTVRLRAGITSAAGGIGMPEATTWSFTTVPLPEIVSTYPANGDDHASPHTEFRIVFNTVIDPGSVMPNLTMTPPISPTQVYTYYSWYDNTFVLYFGAQPSTDYVVTISNGIVDPYGNAIPRGRTVRFRTDPLSPTYQLRVPDAVSTYDAAASARVVLSHLNLRLIDLKLFQLPVTALHESPWRWLYEAPPSSAQLIREWQVRLEAPLDKQENTPIDVGGSDGGRLSPGVYLLELDAPELDRDTYWRNQRHMLVVSDLSLTMKTGVEDILIWATSLADGQPVPSLALNIVEVDGSSRQTARTGSDGVARLSFQRNHGTLIAYSDNPFAAVSSDWSRGIGPWDFNVSEGEPAQTRRIYIYTDRPIYRPGQTVAFKGTLRSENDAVYSLPDPGQVNVIVRNMMGEELYNGRLPLSALGTFDGSLDLASDAALGQYSISVMLDGADGALWNSEALFIVAEYRAPEFEVSVVPEQDEIQRGSDLRVSANLSYFFGGPLKDTDVKWTILSESFAFTPSWGGSYTFSDVDDPYVCFDCWWWEPPAPRSILSGQGTTDREGRLAIAVAGETLAAALEKGARRITIEATATGPDNQEIAGRGSVIVHPGPHYIGIQARSYVSQAGRPAEIDLVAVDWLGDRIPDTSLQVSLYHREWINTFVKNDVGGGTWTWETKDTLVEEKTVTTDNLGEAVTAFVMPEAGSYHVVATPALPSPSTEAIRSSLFIWVSGQDYVSWRRDNHDRITLISDKATYQVGDTAEILIPSPFETPHVALVTIEREGVRRYEVIRLDSNSAVYRLPIVEEDIPNIYVSVVLIKSRGADPAALKMGLIPLEVSPDQKTLQVTVETDRSQAGPGEDVTYTLTARGHNGEPVSGAELSLDLVDKAVLSLMPRTQDILSGLYGRRILQVSTACDLSLSMNRYLQQLAEDLDIAQLAADGQGARDESVEMPAMEAPAPMATAMPAAATGAGAALPEGVEIRSDFADTAYWTARLLTDTRGQASATVTLPDNLTTWVARSVGLTAETLVGEGQAEVVATKPLLVRPVAPRFFVVADRAQLAANVSNNTDGTLDVEVRLTAEGLVLDTATPGLQTIAINPHSESKVTWWVTIDDVTQTDLIFSAVSGTYSDASRPRLTTGPDGTLLVLRYSAPDTVGTAGQLTDGGTRTEAIALPPVLDERRGELTVQLDPSLAAGMQDGLRYLEHYEYECTEQTVSRFLPNVLTYHALSSLGIDQPDLAARLPDLLDEGLAKLYAQQNPDGGWGWWHRAQEPQSNPYVSGYVVFALLRARQADLRIDQQVLQKGLAYVAAQIQPLHDLDTYQDANRQAWLLYVLAEGNVVDESDLDALYDQRDKLSTYARAYLAQAIWLRPSAAQAPNDARLKTLLSDINNAAILSASGAHWVESHHDWWAMNTDTRSTAIVLDTLTKLDPGNALLPNVVRWLMIARRAGVWETTQETAWALIALTDWMTGTGELDADYDFALYLNDVQQASASASRETIRESVKVTTPISTLNADATNALTIARTPGEGRLYYTAHLQVYLPVESIQAEDRGFVVYRRSLLCCRRGSTACGRRSRKHRPGDDQFACDGSALGAR
ncbi:MAG: Ig-like domain-containing protein [Anaerolineae bacterium]|nr:Ig-like domain-containing protein [Anaerolineae bacterium]